MVRREDADGKPSGSRCSSPAGASPASVSAGAPSSRPQARPETAVARAGCQKPLRREQVRGPQHEVKPAASTDLQPESRAGHVTAKVTSPAPRSGGVRAGGLGGVWGAARGHGGGRNTRGPSAQPGSGQRVSHKPKVKAGAAQRESEGASSRRCCRTSSCTCSPGSGRTGGRTWGRWCAYADDFVVMCDTKAAVEAARERVGLVLARLGLKLHPEKTRVVDLADGREGFDFLGCHLHKRMSGPIWVRSRRRVYYLHRWPSRRAMKQVRARVRALTPRGRCHTDLRLVIADLNRVVRGRGQYFRTGNAAHHFVQLDQYVEERLRGLLLKRAGSRLAAGRARAWRRPFFEALGLFRLRGTIRYPGVVHAAT